MNFENEQEYNEECGNIEYFEKEYLQAQRYAEFKQEQESYQNTVWTNGAFTISWLYDQVVIKQHSPERFSIMNSGDFEYALQALLSANPINKEDLY